MSIRVELCGREKMSNTETPITINEHLSALLDDQAGDFEQRRVLDELKVDPSLSRKLSTYALIGETMRIGESDKPLISLGSSFLGSIHEKIELEDDFDEVFVKTGNESSQLSQSKAENSTVSWFLPIGGFAVAASVGALAFMGLQNMGLLNNPNLQPDGIVNSSAPTAIVDVTPVTSTVDNTVTSLNTSNSTNDGQYADADSQTRSLLKRYVDSHMQYATSSAFVPSVRVIAYTDNQ
ncbi:MAG: sigma-E factor negative regulatory protein RseA [Cocleimonas sp.]